MKVSQFDEANAELIYTINLLFNYRTRADYKGSLVTIELVSEGESLAASMRDSYLSFIRTGHYDIPTAGLAAQLGMVVFFHLGMYAQDSAELFLSADASESAWRMNRLLDGFMYESTPEQVQAAFETFAQVLAGMRLCR